MVVNDRVPEIDFPDFDFDDAAELEVRRALARAVANSPGVDGRTPFQELLDAAPGSANRQATVPTPLPEAIELEPCAPTDRMPHRRGRWMAAAAVLIVFVTLCAAALSRVSNEADEMPTLAALVEEIGEQPDHPLEPGEYWYQQTAQRIYLGAADPVSSTVDEQVWTAVDGTGRSVTHLLDEHPDGSVTEVNPDRAEAAHPEPGELKFLGFTYEELRDLPQEPIGLAAVLRDQAETDGMDAVEQIAALARADVATPGTRKAALEILLGMGGGVTSRTKDPQGRSGISVSGSAQEGPWTVILKESTGVPLAVYVGYATTPEGVPDLNTAPNSRVFGSQKFTDSTS